MGVAAPHPTGGVGRFTVASVVPMFNGAETVERCLRSILAQERPADEIVVVDDGSTDESAAVVERIADSRITLIRQPNRGVSAARNAGTRAASSDFVTFLDCDDYAKVGWLAALMAAAEENDALVVAASYEQVGDTSAAQGDPSLREPSSRAPYLAGSYLVSRAVLEEVGGFDERLRYSENHEFFMRIQSYCDEHGAEVIRLNQKLVVVDRSHSGASARWRLDAVRLILSKHGEEIRSDPRRHSRWLGIGAVESVRHGQPTAALRYALAAVRSTPQSSRCWLRLLACLCYPVARARWGSYEEAPA